MKANAEMKTTKLIVASPIVPTHLDVRSDSVMPRKFLEYV